MRMCEADGCEANHEGYCIAMEMYGFQPDCPQNVSNADLMTEDEYEEWIQSLTDAPSESGVGEGQEREGGVKYCPKCNLATFVMSMTDDKRYVCANCGHIDYIEGDGVTYETEELRDELKEFAMSMEKKLSEKDEEYGDSWKGVDLEYMFWRLADEISEWEKRVPTYDDYEDYSDYADAVLRGDEHPPADELIDIANVCMMLHHRLKPNAPPEVEGAQVEGTQGGVGGQQSECAWCHKKATNLRCMDCVDEAIADYVEAMEELE